MNSALSELLANAFLVVGALFPIVNPLGNTPIFLMLTRGLSGRGRTKLARTIAINGLVLMVASIFIGTYILGFFGISLPVVQVGGGLIVISTGWTLLRHSDDVVEVLLLLAGRQQIATAKKLVDARNKLAETVRQIDELMNGITTKLGGEPVQPHSPNSRTTRNRAD